MSPRPRFGGVPAKSPVMASVSPGGYPRAQAMGCNCTVGVWGVQYIVLYFDLYLHIYCKKLYIICDFVHIKLID